jgi:F-type H+-transporting ATPase subunit epsilon
MTAMADHAPTITTLRPGLLKVTHAGGTDEYVVSGGFAEITAGAVSVLAEKALAKADVTQDLFDAMVGQAREAQANATDVAVDEAAKLVADMVAMGEELGLSAR